MNFSSSDMMPQLTEGHLFNNQEFHKLKDSQGVFYYNEEGVKVNARLSFYIIDKTAISGYGAPFGSIDFNKDFDQQELQSFISKCLEELSSIGVSKAIIKQPAGCYTYSTNSELILLESGFRVTATDLNQHLNVTAKPFREVISQKERNKLNRAELEPYQFKILDPSYLSEAFVLINDTYTRNGNPVTMKEAELKLAFDKLPNSYKLFGLFDKDRLIAVVVSVRVNSTSLYNFYHADLESYRTRSPMVMLIGGIYDYCFKNGLNLLDLGISSVEGSINEGLYRFKKNLGCLETDKKTFVLEL